MAEDFDRGNELFVDEKFAEALESFNKAIEIDAKNIKYYLQRSATFCALKQYQDALNDSESALQIDDTSSLAYFRKGVALFELKDVKQSLKAFFEGENLSGDHTAKFEKWIDKCKASIMATMNVIEEKAKILKMKGNECFKTKKYTNAIELYEQAVKLDISGASKALLFGNMANAFMKLKKYAECLEAATKATESNPVWKKGHYWKGMALFYLRDFEASIQAFQSGLAIDQSDEDLQKKINALHFFQTNSSKLKIISSEDWFIVYDTVSRNMNILKTDKFAQNIMRLSRKGKAGTQGTQPTIIDKKGMFILSDVPINALTESELKIQNNMKNGDMFKIYTSVVVDSKAATQTLFFQQTEKLNSYQVLVLELTSLEANKTPFNEFIMAYI